ncbi:hypothetical protein Lal_00038518 [Lupinus albus]|nr:hypothetical protein Lal_00038518 [Lupinus albus]
MVSEHNYLFSSIPLMARSFQDSTKNHHSHALTIKEISRRCNILLHKVVWYVGFVITILIFKESSIAHTFFISLPYAILSSLQQTHHDLQEEHAQELSWCKISRLGDQDSLTSKRRNLSFVALTKL